jgi:hypothetical protein
MPGNRVAVCYSYTDNLFLKADHPAALLLPMAKRVGIIIVVSFSAC